MIMTHLGRYLRGSNIGKNRGDCGVNMTWQERRVRLKRYIHPERLIQDPVSSRVKNATHKQLAKYYHEIINEGRSFRVPIRLSSLIPILNAGWKDAGINFSN